MADLQSFREALGVLQRQVEDLDQLKARHYAEIIEHEEEVWDVVQGKVTPHSRLSLWIMSLRPQSAFSDMSRRPFIARRI